MLVFHSLVHHIIPRLSVNLLTSVLSKMLQSLPRKIRNLIQCSGKNTEFYTPGIFILIQIHSWVSQGNSLSLSHFLHLYNGDAQPYLSALSWCEALDVKCFPSVLGWMQAALQGDTQLWHQFQCGLDRNLPSPRRAHLDRQCL